MNKQVELSTEARQKLVKGINKVADAVTSTLGPSGRNVIYTEFGEVKSTKDGVTVAKQIEKLEDPLEEMGAQLIKQTAIKTATNAGDGTTTSTLLAQAIIKEGLQYLDKGVNATEMKKGIDSAVKEVIKTLKTQISKDISSEEQLKQIASISANNDPEIGNLIATAMEKVGREGIIHIEESKTGETYLETVEGIQFDKGYKSPYFVTDNNTMTSVLEEPLILIVDKKLTHIKEFIKVLEGVSVKNKSLLIIAEDFADEVLSTLIVNKGKGTLKVCAVKAPEFGDRRKLVLEDIAIMTGGQVVSFEKGMKLDKFQEDWFGSARIITISKEQTTIVDGKGDQEKINQRIEEIKIQIENSQTAFEKEKLQERLAKFVGGVSIIHVGGNSELEIKEKKDRVDDALHATKAALEEGIVPGGGTSLLYARDFINFTSFQGDVLIGADIIFKACFTPFKKILINAGYSEEECFGLIPKFSGKNYWKGYNLKTQKFVNMEEAGILDPTKVTRCALENAASIAGTVLLTEAAIVEINKKPESNDMGGMF